MQQVDVDGLTINYDVQGEGDPLLLIPYTAADHACYAFQLPSYTEHFSCIALDLPGSGESDKPAGPYSTEGYANQVAAFLGAIGIERAHVAGVSLGAAVGMHLAAQHPERVSSLSLHSGWHATDAYLKVVVEQWRTLALELPSVADVVIQGIFPWCFTPEMYVERPEFVVTLEDFVRGRPAQPVDGFLAQTDAVLAHDAGAALSEIHAPTLITFGAHDLVCSTRFAQPLKGGIAGSELVVFDHLSHAGLHEDPEVFNRATLDFLLRQLVKAILRALGSAAGDRWEDGDLVTILNRRVEPVQETDVLAVDVYVDEAPQTSVLGDPAA
jgi:pimeloyl-ACP methyl ester carboxylesterase